MPKYRLSLLQKVIAIFICSCIVSAYSLIFVGLREAMRYVGVDPFLDTMLTIMARSMFAFGPVFFVVMCVTLLGAHLWPQKTKT